MFKITHTLFIIILTYSILLLIPEFVLIRQPNALLYPVCVVFNFLFYFSWSYVLCIIGRLFGTTVEKLWHSFWHVAIYFFSISSMFLYILFGLHWDAFTLELINETNHHEATGFVTTYFTNAKFYWLVFGYAIIAGIEIFLLRHSTNKTITFGKLKWPAIAVLILMLCHVIMFTPNYEWNYKVAKGLPIKHNTLWKLEQSVVQFAENQKEFDTCAIQQQGATIDSCSHTSPNIVVIVGESFNKHHSSLYGYDKDTNPFLSKEENLFIYKDVIAPFNLTSECFKRFLSLASADDSISWCEAPMFPALLKKAGYHVTFYSNQYNKETEHDRFDAKAGFFSHPAIEPYIIDERNHGEMDYDEDLIDLYKKNRRELENHPNNLIIFHLYGQHFPANDKYPGNFNYFHATDYAHRTELDDSQRQEVAEYDNATRYNDYIVHKIIDMFRGKDAIIIYFSDHGDECNDFRPKIGRSYDFSIMDSRAVHCQFDIPFMIYVSDTYKNNHPEIIQEIQDATDRRFITDDLPHLVLYLAGIDSKWYRPQRNLISPDYDNSRRRLINQELIDYDEFCRTPKLHE